MVRLPPTACASLLEQAQCGSEADASRALRQVICAGDGPHPVITDVLFQLLQVHPRCTIPHVPDLISSSAADVATAVEAFGELLPTDRSLLVPILGALGDMPLTKSHEVAARATLKFALDTVDSDDLPAVVRSMLRCCTRSPGLARQAMATLRSSLQRNLPHHVGSILSIVVSEHAKSKSQVGKAFRTPAIPYPTASGLDIAVWLVCLQRARVAFDSIGDEVTESIRMSTKSGALLTTAQHKISAQIDMAARIAAESPQGVVALIDVVVQSLSEEPIPIHEHFALIFLVSRLLKWCPAAMNSTVSHLSRAAASGSESNLARISEIVLLGLIRYLSGDGSSGLGRTFTSPHHQLPSVAISLALRSDMWDELFVRMRKGFVFGGQVDRAIVCKLAYYACETGSIAVIRQVVSLMNATVPRMFSDSLAVSFLVVVKLAVMNGALDTVNSKNMFEERIQLQVPKQLFKDDGSGIRVDLAAINDKNPNSVTLVVGAGLALFCRADESNSKKKSLASIVISSTVLVPVVCLPLYEAAQHSTSAKEVDNCDEEEVNSQASTDLDDDDYKPRAKSYFSKVEKLSSEEFEDALEGCITSIAALTGLINTACIPFPNSTTWNILKIRANSALRYADGALQDDMWALLDRISELLIMIQGVCLAGDYSGFQDDVGSDDCSEEGRTNLGRKIPAKLRKRAEDVLHGADFPSISFSAVISGLVAIPDEKLESDLNKCSRDILERDGELSRIEEFLLRRLLSIISVSAEDDRDNGPDGEGGDYFSLSQLNEEEISDLMHEIKSGNDGQAFLAGVNTEKAIDNEQKRRRCMKPQDDWASPHKSMRDDLTMKRMFRFSSFLSADSGIRSEIDIFYSPEFAALLLDRAIMNVYVCSERRRRPGSSQRDDLKSGNKSAGFALRILAHSLMNASREEDGKGLANFVTSMGNNLIVKMATADGDKNLLRGGGFGLNNVGMEKGINGLVYISKTSVDATTATLSLDVLALLAEFGVICSGAFRELCLSSTETLHEFNNITLWGTEDFERVQVCGGRNVQNWLSRKRRCGSQPSCDDEVYKHGPWITLSKTKKYYKLCQLFNGMYTLDAAIEATSMVEIDLKKSNVEDESSNRRIPQVRVKKRVIFDTEVLVEFLLNVVGNGLYQLKCESSMNVAGSLCPTWVSLTYWWARCVHGIMERIDANFEKYMHQITALVLHPLRAIIDANLSSYSSTRTVVPNLTARTMYELMETNGHYLDGIVKMVETISNDMKKDIINMKEVRKGRSGRGTGIAKLENTIEALKRTASRGTKILGKYKRQRKEISVKRGDGVGGFRRRRGLSLEETEGDESSEDDEMESSGMEEEEGNRKDTVVISFLGAY